MQTTLDLQRAAVLEGAAQATMPEGAGSIQRWAFYTNMTIQGDGIANTVAMAGYNNTHTLMSGAFRT